MTAAHKEAPRSFSGRIGRAGLGNLATPADLLLVGVIFVLGFIYYEWISITQYKAHQFYLADVGVIDTVIANTLRGKLLQSPISDWNILAIHFQMFLLFMVPLYAICDHVLTLVTLYNLGLLLAIFPLFLFSLNVLKDQRLAAAFVVAYLLNHFVLSIHLANHPESLVFVSLFGLFWAGTRSNNWVYWLCILWTLINKEDFSLYLLLYGLYLAFVTKDRNLTRGLLTAGFSLFWFIIAILIMHWLRPVGQVYKGGVPFLERYASLGDSPGRILAYALTHPAEIGGRIFRLPLFELFASLAFLSLAYPRILWILILPALLFLTADLRAMHDLLYYYSYAFIPFLFYAAIKGSAVILHHLPKLKWPIITSLIAISIVSLFLPTRTDGLYHRGFAVTAHHRLAQQLIRRYIPADASVAAQYDLFCQIPHRKTLLPLWEENIDKVEYAIVDLKGRPLDLSRERFHQILQRLSGPEFTLLAQQDGYLIFKSKLPLQN